MIILERKKIIRNFKIYAIVFCVIFGVISVSVNNFHEKEYKNILETVATPIDSKVIIVDARTWISRWTEQKAVII